MSGTTMNAGLAEVSSPRPHLEGKPHIGGAVAFLLVLAAGLGYAAWNIFNDLSGAGEGTLAIGAFVLLGIALLIALGLSSSTASTTPPTLSQPSSTPIPCRRWWL